MAMLAVFITVPGVMPITVVPSVMEVSVVPGRGPGLGRPNANNTGGLHHSPERDDITH
jgi:hypothetical protein